LSTSDKNLIHEPDIPYRSTLLEVMSSCYLISLNYSIYISKCVELPICIIPAEFLRYRLLNPMMKATQGSIDGACLAIEYGWAINLSGGYHHATKSSGGGFCIYPDITFAIQNLRKWHPEYQKVMIIDLDAHQGNGHERDLVNDENVFIVDCFNK
jgi:histone deacetylase 11